MDKNFIVDGKTEYMLVVSPDSDFYETYAKDEFLRLFKEATGIDIPVVTEVLEFSSDKKIISIGRTDFFKGSGVRAEYDELKRDGYKIVTKGNSLILVGGGGYGTVYAVYGFFERQFDYRYYMQDEWKITEKQNDKLLEFDVTDIPDIENRTGRFWYPIIDPDCAIRMRTFSNFGDMRDGSKFFGSWDHNHISYYLPLEKYYDEHPDWYSPDKTQLCLSNEEMWPEMVKLVKKRIVENEKSEYFLLGQEDIRTYCDCPRCTEQIKLYYQLSAWVTDNGVEVQNAITYSSSDTSIATVDSNGNVKAVGFGTAYITVSTELNGEKATADCEVQVREMLSLAFKTGGDIVVGESRSIQTEIRDGNGEVIDRPVTWSTRDGSIVTVDSQGSITGKGAGKTQIVASVNGEEFSLDVLVYSPVKTVQDLLGLDKAATTDNFRLVNDITVKVNGIEAVEEGSDAKWTMYDTGNKRYSLMNTFNSVLDGNGHKITLINTTAVEAGFSRDYEGQFSGLFRSLGSASVIRNTVFDIQIAQSTKGGYMFCASTVGEIENCVFKIGYGGTNANMARWVSGGSINNVIFDFSSASVKKLFYGIESAANVNNIMTIGANTVSDEIDALDSYVDCAAVFAAQPAFGANTRVLELDYANNEIKLCGKTVLDEYSDYKYISTVSEFMQIDDFAGKFVLMNDITIKVNGIETVEAGSDAKWTMFDTSNKRYSLLSGFNGVLDGNGHKITLINTTAVEGEFEKNYEGQFSGIFRSLGETAVIKNTVFDIQIAASTKGGYMFCATTYGTIEDCLIKLNYTGSNANVARWVYGGSFKNVVFDLSDATKITKLFYGVQSAATVNPIVVIGTNTLNEEIDGLTKYTDYAAVFAAKPTFDSASWTFDYENGAIKLCGKTVLANAIAE